MFETLKKLKFGARCGSYLTMRLAGTLRGRLCMAARHQKQQIKQWLKRKLPALVPAPLGRKKTKAQASRTNESTE